MDRVVLSRNRSERLPLLEANSNLFQRRFKRYRRYRTRLSLAAWLFTLLGIGLVAIPFLQRAYAELAQVQLRGAMEQELEEASHQARTAGTETRPNTVAPAASSGLRPAVASVADVVIGAVDTVLATVDSSPQLLPQGEDGLALPTREEVAGVSRIIIEKADVDAMVVDGTTPRDLRRGPGFYPEGSLPDAGGNVAIAGHRTTYGAWFRHLDRLRVGDPIHLVYEGKVYDYEVEWVRVIEDNDWSVIEPTGEHVLTLTTCHPPGSSAFRLAVRARWVGTRDLPRPGLPREIQ